MMCVTEEVGLESDSESKKREVWNFSKFPVLSCSSLLFVFMSVMYSLVMQVHRQTKNCELAF